jgi:NYN domain
MDLGLTKSALYIDFDNFFGGLIAVDPKAAIDVVQRPSLWVKRLRAAHSQGGRRWLVLRCYMNPAGWVPHPTVEGERLYFSRYRPFFTQAGFEIVDCPSLTRNSKNGADIRMTVDIMTALRASTRYDEVVIASSDSDFTHLLQVVRADDRRIVMIATSGTAAAYQSLADTYLDEQDMLDLMHEPEEGDGLAGVGAGEAAMAIPDLSPSEGPLKVGSDEQGVHPSPADAVDWNSFAADVRSTYDTALEPLNLARWSTVLIERFGHGLIEGRWFGTGGFARALERAGLQGLSLSQHFAWDTGRHQAPDDQTTAANVVLPSDIARFCEIVQLPRIPSDRWPVVFRTLEAYAMLHEFQLTESTRWSRDHAAQQGIDIPRNAFSYVVRGCVVGGAPLNADPPPMVDRIGEALLMSVIDGASRAGLDVTDDERAALRAWLHLDEPA